MGSDSSSTKQIIKAASACVWRGDQVLLVQRGKTLGHGLWALPGGKMEPGETAQQAAARELLEETGVTADLAHHVGHFALELPNVIYDISCWTGHYLSGTPTPRSDAMNVCWATPSDFARLRLGFNNDTAIAQARLLIHNL